MNKHLIFFVGLSSIFIVTVLTAMNKMVTAIFKQSHYYCKILFNSFIAHLPGNIVIIPFLLLFLIAIAVIIKALFIWIRINRFRKKFICQKQLPQRLHLIAKRLKLKNNIRLIKEVKPFAFCLGILRPKIYLSTALISLMNDRELEAILLHERYHLKKSDATITAIASFLLTLFPFFPLLKDLWQSYKIEQEINADREAINGLGARKPLASVLTKLLRFEPTVFPYARGLIESGTLEYRICALLKKSCSFKRIKWQNLMISLLSLVLILAFILIPIQQTLGFFQSSSDKNLMCLQTADCLSDCIKSRTKDFAG